MKNNEVVTKITTSLEVVECRRQHSSHLGLPDTVQVFGKRFQVEMWIFSVSRLSSSNLISQHNNTFESALQGSAQRFTPLGNKRVESWRCESAHTHSAQCKEGHQLSFCEQDAVSFHGAGNSEPLECFGQQRGTLNKNQILWTAVTKEERNQIFRK